MKPGRKPSVQSEFNSSLVKPIHQLKDPETNRLRLQNKIYQNLGNLHELVAKAGRLQKQIVQIKEQLNSAIQSEDMQLIQSLNDQLKSLQSDRVTTWRAALEVANVISRHKALLKADTRYPTRDLLSPTTDSFPQTQYGPAIYLNIENWPEEYRTALLHKH